MSYLPNETLPIYVHSFTFRKQKSRRIRELFAPGLVGQFKKFWLSGFVSKMVKRTM